MTRTQYNKARRLLRDNGKYALLLMTGQTREIMEALMYQPDDRLHERDCIIRYCKREGYSYNLRQIM